MGAYKVPFAIGLSRYDDPPPDPLTDPAALIANNRCRFCNRLTAFIEVEDGRIVGYDQTTDGLVGSTTLRLGRAAMTFAAVVFPTLRPEPVVTPTSVTFRQTCGARTGVPAPRPVKRPPFIQFSAPTAWTTLELEIHADGTSTGRLVGASHFPRHWVYDRDGRLEQKSSVVDFKTWAAEHFGDRTPWGDVDSPALTSAVESALERELSAAIMRDGEKPPIRTLQPGTTLCEQGERGDELYLLLDGVLEISDRRRAAGGARPGRGAGRAGSPRRRPPHLDAARAHPLQGRLRPEGEGRPRPARRAADWPSSRRDLALYGIGSAGAGEIRLAR